MVNMMGLEMEKHPHFQFHNHMKKYPAGQFTLKKYTMDILMIGANGFAKVGDPNVDRKAEIKLNLLLIHFNTSFSIPEEFKAICGYKVQRFRFGLGIYSELLVVYNDMIIEDWACDSDYHEQLDRF